MSISAVCAVLARGRFRRADPPHRARCGHRPVASTADADYRSPRGSQRSRFCCRWSPASRSPGLIWQQTHDDAIEALRRDTAQQTDALVSVWRSGVYQRLAARSTKHAHPATFSLIIAVIDGGGRRVAGVGPAVVTTGQAGAVDFRIGRIGGFAALVVA